MEGIRREGFLVVGDWVSKLDLEDNVADGGGEATGGSRLGVAIVVSSGRSRRGRTLCCRS